MEKKVIYFVSFEGRESKADRMKLVDGDGDVGEFFEWIKEQRQKSEEALKTPLVVTNASIIR